jgi:hypothetical protein
LIAPFSRTQADAGVQGLWRMRITPLVLAAMLVVASCGARMPAAWTPLEASGSCTLRLGDCPRCTASLGTSCSDYTYNARERSIPPSSDVDVDHPPRTDSLVPACEKCTATCTHRDQEVTATFARGRLVRVAVDGQDEEQKTPLDVAATLYAGAWTPGEGEEGIRVTLGQFEKVVVPLDRASVWVHGEAVKPLSWLSPPDPSLEVRITVYGPYAQMTVGSRSETVACKWR